MDTAASLTAVGVAQEPVRTPEQLHLIHLAMMEELGIGRMDTLPLEDKKHGDDIPLAQQALRPRNSTNDGVAGWNNFDPGDVPEAYRQLDPIADGQLYRIRRHGGSSGVPQTRGGHSASTGSHSPSRRGRSSVNLGSDARHGDEPKQSSPPRNDRGKRSGRGNRGDRGGPSSLHRRGRGPSSRTEHGSQNFSSTPSTFLNDARDGVGNQALIKKAIYNLRAPLGPTAQLQENQPPTAPRFGNKLPPPDAFLVAMGVTARSENASARGPSGVSAAPKSTNAKIRLASSKYASLQPAILAQPPTPVFSNTSTGLASSRYALTQPAPTPSTATSCTASSASPSRFVVPPSPTSNPHPNALTPTAENALNNFDSPSAPNFSSHSTIAAHNSAPSDTKSTVSRSIVPAHTSVVFEKPVKTARNGDARITEGKVRLIKTGESLDLEFGELKNDKSLAVQWRLHLSKFTFASALDPRVSLITVGSDTSTYDIEFQFPLGRKTFHEHLRHHLTALKIRSEPDEAAIFEATAMIIKSSDSMEKASVSDITPHAPVNSVSAALNVSNNGQASSLLVSKAPAPEVPPSAQKVPAYMKKPETASFAKDPESSSTPVAPPVVNGAVLIDLSEAPADVNSTLPAVNSEINSLLCFKNHGIVASVVAAMDMASGSTFMEANHDESAEVLASIAEDFTMSHLQCTSSFRNGFSKDIKVAYAKEIAKRALEMAQAQARTRERAYGVEGSYSNIDDSAVYGEMSNFEDYDLHEAGDSQELGGYQNMNISDKVGECHVAIKPQQVSESCQLNGKTPIRRASRKYSVQELTGLHGRALSIISPLPQPPTVKTVHSSTFTPPMPSREHFAAQAADIKAVFESQCSAAENSYTASTIGIPLQPSQASFEVHTPLKPEHFQNDPALYGIIQSTIAQDKPSTVKPKDLEITATTPKSSADFTPAPKPIGSSDRNEVKKVPVLGLSSSRWNPDNASAARHASSYPSSAAAQQQYAPTHGTALAPSINSLDSMLAVRGLEVVGKTPVAAYQLVGPLTHQYDGGFQSFPHSSKPISPPQNPENMFQGFPPPLNMYDRQASGSSTESEAKFLSARISPIRTPLSPRKANIQATFKEKVHQSLTEKSI